MKRIPTLLIVLSAIATLIAPATTAGSAARPATKEERDFYASVVVPVLNSIKKAMPPAPNGWIVASEEKNPSAPPEQVTGDSTGLHLVYTITYKRLTGLKEEQLRLDEAYAESSNKNQEAAKPLIDELIQQQTETSVALRKASRMRNQHEMQRLNDELDENGRKMRAIHEDVDRKISRDVEPYLVKDAEASIRISLNDNRLDLLQGEPFVQHQAAFALRREGERSGIASWREGRTVILFGNWELEGQGRFRANIDQPPFSPKVQTITITVAGDRKRVNTLIGQIDLRTILGLMK